MGAYEPDKGIARADGDRFAESMNQTDHRLHRLENRRPRGGGYRYAIITVDSSRAGTSISRATYGSPTLIDWSTVGDFPPPQPYTGPQGSGLGVGGYGISQDVWAPSFIRTVLPETPGTDLPEPVIHWPLDPAHTYYDESGTIPLTPDSGDYSFTDAAGGVEGTALMYADWNPAPSDEWTIAIVCAANTSFISAAGVGLLKFGNMEIELYTLISDQGRMRVNDLVYGFVDYYGFYEQRYLYTFVYDGTNVKVYLNKNLEFTRSETWDITSGGVTLNFAGSEPFFFPRQHLYYFDTALTAEQVEGLWNLSVPGVYR